MNQNEEKLTQLYKWNPWIGCHKKSTGCLHCASAQELGQSYHQTIKLDLGNFDLPLQTNKKGQYYIPLNSYIALEYNSDFFIQDMDFFRPYIWNIIKYRQDCTYFISTKRPERIEKCLPKDWNNGWDNIDISCTAETQELIEQRLPIYLNLPLKTYRIICSPLTEKVTLSNFLINYKIDSVSCQGEYILNHNLLHLTRPCKYEWVKNLANQCKQYNIPFTFSVTGTKWINKNNKVEYLSPYGWTIKDKATECHLSTGNLFNMPTDYYNFINIQKE